MSAQPYNQRTLEPIRDLCAYKRARVDKGDYVDGADSLDLTERLLATIDLLAERVKVAEEQARVNVTVDAEYAATRDREAAAYRAIAAAHDGSLEAAFALMSQVGDVR